MIAPYSEVRQRQMSKCYDKRSLLSEESSQVVEGGCFLVRQGSRVICSLIGCLALFTYIFVAAPLVPAEEAKKPFTVADDIGITVFWPLGFKRKMVQFSPDGNYVAVYSERGRLKSNRVEDSLRFYRSREISDFLRRGNASQPPTPVWIVTYSDKEGPIINDWRWLPNSSGVAFLEGPVDGNKRLVLGDLLNEKLEVLTRATEAVEDFDINDRQHFTYIAASSAHNNLALQPSVATVGTGRRLSQLLFPGRIRKNYYLWAIVDGKRFEVENNGTPFLPALGARSSLALSPDGQSVVTQVVVANVPSDWETLYPPPNPSYPWRNRGGRQNLQAGDDSVNYVRQYVLIRLRRGVVEPLIDAPESSVSGWQTGASPNWSRDGKAILLPGTFLPSYDHLPSRPCIAIVDLDSHRSNCLESLTNSLQSTADVASHFVTGAQFIGGDKERIVIAYSTPMDHALGATEYRVGSNDSWRIVEVTKGQREVWGKGLELAVEESFDRPPVLVAKEKTRSRVIWDPNDDLRGVDLGQATIYKWKTKDGREWKGGLYRPSDFKVGLRYPLVIQTHGFFENYFHASGLYPTASAARELAVAGIVVLQVADDACATLRPDEAPCAVSVYEAAAKQLVSDGLVDPERVGIVGFSRTCFYVMEALTSGSLHLKAASITDGQMITYLQYMLAGGALEDGNSVAGEFEKVIGARPFGEGLPLWLKRSVGFNLDKVSAPLLITAEGPSSLLFMMWEPYAGLYYLNKPVDLILLNTREHVLTNPQARMASQSASVDWFRFWLKDEEDPNPEKADQYRRWRELRDLELKSDNTADGDRARSN